MGILYSIRNVMMGLAATVASPFVWLAAQVKGPARSRAMVLGTPAMVVGLVCLVILAAITLRQDEPTKQRYQRLADAAKMKAERTLEDLLKERRITEQASQTDPNAPAAETGTEESPLVKQLRMDRAAQQMYLEKLIALDRSEKHLFEYARSFAEIAPDLQFKLMQQLAPNDRLGYGEAHLFLAEFYVTAVVTDATRERQIRNAALIHADFALQRMPDSLLAKSIKLAALLSLRRFSEALPLAEELFKNDPLKFRELVLINRELNRPQDVNNALADAARRLEEKIREFRQSNIEQWTIHMNNYVSAMVMMGRFEECRRRLDQEIEIISSAESGGMILHLKRLKAEAGIYWVRAMNPGLAASPETLAQCLPLLEEALRELPRHPDALWLLTLISFRKDEWRDRALAIYNPEVDPQAPAIVLNQMGKHALLEKNYASAIDLFERARQLETQNPEMLNNLAYAYLTAGVGDPEHALSLVNEAISLLPPLKEMELLRSSFFHTKGTALLVLNRFEEAAAAFSVALEARPENQGILEGLVRAYEAQGSKQAEIYKAKLEQIKLRESGNQSQ